MTASAGSISTLAANAEPRTLYAILADRTLPFDDRFAAYAVLQQVRLRIHRKLDAARDELVAYLESTGTKAIGPVSVKRSAVGVHYVCNDPGNWDDADIQDRLRTWRIDRATSTYVRHVPDHFEVDQMALGGDVLIGVPDALAVWDECNARGWRTEERESTTLAVAEAK